MPNLFKLNLKKFLSLIVLISSFQNLKAADYYADPIGGSMSNDGSSLTPWSSLEDVMNSSFTFSAGDIIYLRTGNHGFPKINGTNSALVEITAEAGQSPIIDRIYIGNVSTTSNWKLSNLTVMTENVSAYPISLITLYPSTSNVTIQNCSIQSTDNTAIYSRDDWRDKTNHGIRSQGADHSILNNTISNVAVGLSIESESTLIQNNEIQYFTIDGIRGLASDCTFESNSVKDNIAVFTYSENHYDGFQSYTCCPVGTDTIKNVILRKNLIINCTDSTRDWRGPMQGMVGFDGYFEDWTIENNIIITDHWHGITLLGAINCKIINNTVIDPYVVSPIDPYDSLSTALHGPAWIKIAAHKNNSLSYDNIIYNNLTADMQNDAGIGLVDFNNVIGASSNYSSHFVDYQNFNLQLIFSSSAIDAGTMTLAPTTDFDGNPRPFGGAVDLGAYEYTINSSGILDLNSDFKIYPNPVQSELTIFQENGVIEDIQMFNALGQNVTYLVTISQKSDVELRIDCSQLPSGIYLIKQQSSVLKFVKK